MGQVLDALTANLWPDLGDIKDEDSSPVTRRQSTVSECHDIARLPSLAVVVILTLEYIHMYTTLLQRTHTTGIPATYAREDAPSCVSFICLCLQRVQVSPITCRHLVTFKRSRHQQHVG